MNAVLVTGASKGIGEACVKRLAANGHRVYAGVRRTEDGAALRVAAGNRVTPILLDVTHADQIAAAAAMIADTLGSDRFAGVVNNAGVAIAGPLEFLPIEELRRQLEINVIGQVAVTQAVLPLIRAGRGRIVFIGSISGRSALPLTGAYAASKHALEALTDALRVELMPWSIDVAIVEPGVIATPIWATSIAAADRMLEHSSSKMLEYYGRVIRAVKQRAAGGTVRGLQPDVVAQAVEHALFAPQPKTRYLIGRDARFRLLFQKLPDRWRDRLIARRLERI